MAHLFGGTSVCFVQLDQSIPPAPPIVTSQVRCALPEEEDPAHHSKLNQFALFRLKCNPFLGRLYRKSRPNVHTISLPVFKGSHWKPVSKQWVGGLLGGIRMILFVTRRRCRSLDRLCRCPSGDLRGRSLLWKRDMFSFLITKFSAHYLLLSVTSLEQWKLPFSRMRLDQTKSGLADCPCDCVLCVNDMPKQPKIVHSCVIAVLRWVCVSPVSP